MPTFEVRQNCEFSIHIEADSKQDAITKAGETTIEDWGQAWSELEAEKVKEGA